VKAPPVKEMEQPLKQQQEQKQQQINIQAGDSSSNNRRQRRAGLKAAYEAQHLAGGKSPTLKLKAPSIDRSSPAQAKPKSIPAPFTGKPTKPKSKLNVKNGNKRTKGTDENVFDDGYVWSEFTEDDDGDYDNRANVTNYSKEDDRVRGKGRVRRVLPKRRAKI